MLFITMSAYNDCKENEQEKSCDYIDRLSDPCVKYTRRYCRIKIIGNSKCGIIGECKGFSIARSYRAIIQPETG